MPTVLVKRDLLFKEIGQTFTDEEFDDLCFQFGIELDDITSEKEMFQNEQKKVNNELSTEILYRIEVGANRYDLLCLEGLALALKTYLKKWKFPTFHVKNVLPEDQRILYVSKSSVKDVRPIGLSAILRGINFTDDKLKAFMELQDKLHNNICRGRKLVSMGTHDLDTVKMPFYYKGIPRKEMKFIPLNHENIVVDGDGLMDLLKDDPKLGKYLYLLDNADKFPCMIDSNNVIMSVPPILNSNNTKMTINTKNVLIDVTGLDYTKSVIVLNTLIAMFSQYCEDPFSVEEIKVVDVEENTSKVYPDLNPRVFKCDVEYLKSLAGIPEVTTEKIIEYLEQMELKGKVLNEKEIEVYCPITRSDILHPCDIASDFAIAYGYDNIKKIVADVHTTGCQQPYNKLTDLFRNIMAQAGYVEFLTFALLSKKDMFTNLLSDNPDEKTASILYAKTKEFEYVRSSLIPCILKCIEGNKGNQLPFKLFEISDVCLVGKQNEEIGVSNRRYLCFAYCNFTSSMELIQGCVDLLMKKIGLQFNYDKDKKKSYTIKRSENKIFFDDRQAEIFIQEGIKIGIYGIIHPKVLKNFGITNPVTLCEIDLQIIMDLILKGELIRGFI